MTNYMRKQFQRHVSGAQAPQRLGLLRIYSQLIPTVFSYASRASLAPASKKARRLLNPMQAVKKSEYESENDEFWMAWLPAEIHA